MTIDINILATILTACLGAVSWLFKTTNSQAKEIVVLQTKIEATNSQVAEIKHDIQGIRADLERANKESAHSMLQMLENLSEIKTSIAVLAREGACSANSKF